MECLHLAPEKKDLCECYELMEGLTNLRPQQVQALLKACTSVKVKRLFLFLAEKAKHDWFEYLDLTKIDLGKGKRSVVQMAFSIKNIK
jgi:Transcriptional regulator, AbiEi antitoxin, Type IV TA system